MSASEVAAESALFRRTLKIALPRGGYVVGVIEGYFDESEPKLGKRVFAVAGYLIHSEQAVVMAEEWDVVLRRYDVPFFHMTDCAPDPGNGAFAKLTKDERIQIVKDLIEIIKKRTISGFAIVTNPTAYDKHSAHAEHVEFGKMNPYKHCVYTLIMMIGMVWAKENNIGEKIYFNFESGYHLQSTADSVVLKLIDSAKIAEEYRYAGHGFLPKSGSPLLQAADILAWQSTKHLKNKLSGRKMRLDFSSLMEHPHLLVYVTPGPNGNLYISPDYVPGEETEHKDRVLQDFYQKGGTGFNFPGPTIGQVVWKPER